MCGRFVVARASAELAAELDADIVTEHPAPVSYNIAPTTQIPVAIDTMADDGTRHRRLESAKWGLVPSWAKDETVAVRAFNARSESAAAKPTFRDSVRKRRAAIPADGYYEWRTAADGSKQPHYIHPADGSLLLFAGLYAWWQRPDNSWLLSATILTRQSPAGPLAELHDRIPVFLNHDDLTQWLNPAHPGDSELVAEFAHHAQTRAAQLQIDRVDRRVGNVRENDARLIVPISQ